jgi:hypothetical protein
MKKGYFIRGLTLELQDKMALNEGSTFNEFVSAAVTKEDAMKAHQDSKKRKGGMSTTSGGSSQQYRLTYTSPSGQRFMSSP